MPRSFLCVSAGDKKIVRTTDDDRCPYGVMVWGIRTAYILCARVKYCDKIIKLSRAGRGCRGFCRAEKKTSEIKKRNAFSLLFTLPSFITGGDYGTGRRGSGLVMGWGVGGCPG